MGNQGCRGRSSPSLPRPNGKLGSGAGGRKRRLRLALLSPSPDASSAGDLPPAMSPPVLSLYDPMPLGHLAAAAAAAGFLDSPLSGDIQPKAESIKVWVLGGISGGDADVHTRKRRRSTDGVEYDVLSGYVKLLRGVAADACDDKMAKQLEDLKPQFLAVRSSRRIPISDPEEYPYPYKKKRKSTGSNSSEEPNVEAHQRPNLPLRRSKRCLEMLKIGDSHLPRARIPLGSDYQADVPDWNGPLTNNKDDDKWLGTRICPTEDSYLKIDKNMVIGRGRPELCFCHDPESVACISTHVRAARSHMRSELGAFFTRLGFNEMGERISKSWTPVEQLSFHDLVAQNPPSEGKSFWDDALMAFPKKSKMSIVSYYFNVFLLRRMRQQTRAVASERIDSDDDESDFTTFSASNHAHSPKRRKINLVVKAREIDNDR